MVFKDLLVMIYCHAGYRVKSGFVIMADAIFPVFLQRKGFKFDKITGTKRPTFLGSEHPHVRVV